MKLPEQAAFYDERWRGFTYANNLKLQRAAAILGELAKLRFQKPQIVDLGCGAGWLTSILSQFGPTTGLELSRLAVERASERFPGVLFVAGDVQSPPLRPESADVVVSQEVIEHLEDQVRHIVVCAGLLRRGGALILTTPNRAVLESMPRDRRREFQNQPIERPLKAGELRRLVRGSLKVSRLSTIVPFHGMRGWRRLLNRRHLDPINSVLGSGLHLLAVARKA